MKHFAALVATLALSLTASAAELTAADTGTFVVLDQKKAPTDLHYRLSLGGGQWVMEGRQSNAAWTNISCEAACQYRPSTAADLEALFPPHWREQADLACIQNHAQAFCRHSPRATSRRRTTWWSPSSRAGRCRSSCGGSLPEGFGVGWRHHGRQPARDAQRAG